MTIEWKDATPYSQGRRGIAPQTAWQTDVRGAVVWVSKGHIRYPGEWVMTCPELDIDNKILGDSFIDPEDAQILALIDVCATVQQRLGWYSSIFEAIRGPKLAE